MERNVKICKTSIPIRDRDREADLDLHIDIGPEYHSLKTVDDLPLEVLDVLFDYLTYTEKLISRVVCQKWNTQISSTLLKKSCYFLESRESLQVLLDSHDAGMDWKKLKIANLCDTGLILPTNLKNSITSLEVSFPKFQSKICEYFRFLTGFPNLTALKVNIGGGPNDKECGTGAGAHSDTQCLSLKEKTVEIYEKLTILSITFPFNDYSLLCKFLSGLNTCQSLTLDSLSIEEEWPTETEQIKDRAVSGRTFVCLPVFNVVCKTAKTLNSLTLGFTSKTILALMPKNILPWLSQTDILKLEDIRIHRPPIRKSIIDYFTALQEFIKIQAGRGKLKNVILPWCFNPDTCEKFLKSLPKDIEFVGNVQDEHLSGQFPTDFPKLKSLCIESDLTKNIFIDVHDNIQRLKFDLRISRTFHPESPYGNMFDNLPNLTEIHFIGNNVLSFDSDLQDIILTMKDQIRVLRLESWKITDYGVLGVTRRDKALKELVETKRVYFPQSPTDNLLPKMKYPLSSMIMLEKLVLIGTNITDVGIILGLKFGKRLKELTFGSVHPRISDFGLYSLGANNPGLEAFHGSFQSGKISTVGIEKMKTQLLLTESTRKFKVVNEKPDE